jgi:P-loop containing NTP hydrolase pore-1
LQAAAAAQPAPAPSPAAAEAGEEDDFDDAVDEIVFADYTPSKITYGRKHPDAVCENSSMASITPPDIWYQPALRGLQGDADVVESGKLSALQLEAIVYASQRHETLLPDGKRAGYFIGQ